MSLEEMFAAHIKALEANTAAVLLLEGSLVGRATRGNDAKIEAKKPDAKPDARKPDPKPEVKPEESKDDAPAGVSFETVRALVLKLAANQREAIKALNAKHGIPKLGALLDNENDFNTVNDQAKLEAMYHDLQDMDGVV